MTLPFDLPDDGAMEARRAATEAWMREEAGLPDESPFADTTLEEAGLADKMQSAVGDDGPPNQDAVAAVAQEALAAGRRRHEEAGFEPPEVDAQAPREPELRGPRLDAGNHQTPPDALWRGVRDGHGRARAQCGHRRP